MKAISSILLAATLAGISSAAEGVAQHKPIPIEQAAKEIEAGVQLLDVRTLEEWNEGHLQGAKRVTLSETGFADQVKAVFDPAKPVVVYCRSGKRSAKATELLQSAGFNKVHDMDGGITAWQKAGKPVVK